jgi:hypothetical protein
MIPVAHDVTLLARNVLLVVGLESDLGIRVEHLKHLALCDLVILRFEVALHTIWREVLATRTL